MDTSDVWRLVDQARQELAETADAGEVAERMSALLARRDPAEIVAFAQPLWDLLIQSYRADLWAAAYLINAGASDDGFDYFRGWLVAQGRTVYEQVLADPDRLAGNPVVRRAAADDEELECGEILGVAWDAHLAATGRELPPGAFTIRYPALDPAWDFDFDDGAEMRRRLPRLAELYDGPAE
ncbi:DUF4240 domain-containing protein [Dactylosporangium sucinum]|uniref:DUF4240 domain-containing protein n=1 Tax=Dactylosporangium sucinum TaxID=1424081 RepID=A0A917TFQ8_9ACTN|nr:DUF4240 domain-containing protein [Dactylosporangium sucinum]GGM21281.1 hypothetical protein GCM10007977_022990 [Dactylosporangium sucinum]